VVNSSTATFTNTSQNAVSYAWDFGDGQTSTVQDPVHSYTADGNYTVRLIATNSCGNDTAYSTVNIITVGGISDKGGVQKVSIYPVPARNILYLSLNTDVAQNCRYEIINMIGSVKRVGQVVFQPGDADASIDINNLEQGVYFIKLMMNDGSVTRKIIIE
jgi:PKD repeat protein